MALCCKVDSAILKMSEKENCIFSPDNIFTIFCILYDAYDRETQENINRLFNWRITEDHETSKSTDLWDGNLKKASKLFLRTEQQLEVCVKDKIENQFGCDIEIINVRDTASSNAVVNWSKKYISDPICNVFQSPSLNSIININFKWRNSFHQNNTIKEKFYKSNTDVIETEFLTQESIFGYKNDTELDAQMFEIPFKNDNISMFFIIPNNKGNLLQLENVLIRNFELEELLKTQKHLMEFSIPKFKFSQMIDIRNIFQQIDYNNPTYKLSTFLPSHLGEMLTRALTEVDQIGVKATATSAFQLILDPIVKEMTFETTIANRFAKTLVTNKVENVENVAQEVTFSMVLPEDAFISEFVMVIEGKSYKSYLKEKEQAKVIYNEAVETGRSAAHVAISARDSNIFTISVNIEPLSETTFLLTYEELLQRRFDQYELVLNIHPGHLVDDLKVLVIINECRKLQYVKTPAIRSGNGITDESDNTNSLAKIEILHSTATIKFEPDLKQQKHIAGRFDIPANLGFSGQFVVQYDVELDPSNGEILVNDGYFVHFYSPDDFPPLAKHVVFTLDTSGSMGGRKMEQLQNAMNCILDQIRKHDLVDILEFTDNVTVYDIDNETPTVIEYEGEENYYEPFYKYEQLNLPGSKPANENIIEKAKHVIKRMKATNSTHMIGGLETALYLIKIGQEKYSDHQPIIVFLTDGEPNVGMENTREITKVVTKLNQDNNKTPIFSLSFGEEADKSFLRKLSLNNFGFSRHIYEASDASLQLQQFYKQISSPLLSNVTFKYESNVEDITRNYFPIYFRGNDIVVCGRYTDTLGPTGVDLQRPNGCVPLKPIINKSITPIERLWAYLTIKQMLEQMEKTDSKEELTNKAVELALKYSFVTEVTSLVVMKPDESLTVDTHSESEVSSNGCFMSIDPRNARVNLVCCVTSDKCLDRMESSMDPINAPMRLIDDEMTNTSSQSEELEESLTQNQKESLAPTNFKIDRPFLIMIQAKLNDKNVILFMGRILEPVCEK